MFRACVVMVAGVYLAAVAAGQSQRPIQWISNAEQGVAQAKRSGLPLLFYVPGSGREGGDLKDAQQRAFRDPLVRGIALERFVPVRLPQSSDNLKMLEQMGARVGRGYCLVIATPRGELVGVIPPGQVTEAKPLARQMTGMFRKYRKDIFDRELKPRLENESTRAADVIKALKQIKAYLIIEADEDVVGLLERDELSKSVKRQVYDVLAALSTSKSVKALFEAALRDKLAANALARCTPGAADELLPALDSESDEEFLLAYEALTKICNIKGKKSRGFWRGKNEQRIAAEIERVRETARKSAKRWRDRYEAYR